MQAFTVTFKLETDAALLDGKIAASLKYGQRAVVGNLLRSHRERVDVWFADGDKRVVERQGEQLIEMQFVALLCDRHQKHAAGSQQ